MSICCCFSQLCTGSLKTTLSIALDLSQSGRVYNPTPVISTLPLLKSPASNAMTIGSVVLVVSLVMARSGLGCARSDGDVYFQPDIFHHLSANCGITGRDGIWSRRCRL